MSLSDYHTTDRATSACRVCAGGWRQRGDLVVWVGVGKVLVLTCPNCRRELAEEARG